jgi:hypothetical protein
MSGRVPEELTSPVWKHQLGEIKERPGEQSSGEGTMQGTGTRRESMAEGRTQCGWRKESMPQGKSRGK